MSADFCVIIPARYASARLPGKPLLPIAGKPMIVHVLERALESGASQAFVATDDARIADAVRAVGGRVVMTSPDHPSGTDRLAEAVDQAGLAPETIIVNLQGDEPFVPGALLARLAGALHGNRAFGMATAATPIHDAADAFNPNVVKVVLDADGGALYFSRAPIPWVRDAFAALGRPETLPAQVPFLRHIGLYAYRVETLKRVAAAPQAAVERAESLEQLRALHLGVRIHVTVVEQAPGHGVDTAEDLARVEREFASRSH